MTYFGAEKVIPHYNVMGVAKAALETCVRYLAFDLGPSGVRVNAISAGPLRTLSAAGISRIQVDAALSRGRAPLRRNVTAEEVAAAALYLCSDGCSRHHRRSACTSTAGTTSWECRQATAGDISLPMYPILFHVFGIPIDSFWASVIRRLLAAAVRGAQRACAGRGTIVAAAYDLILWSYVGGFIGARALSHRHRVGPVPARSARPAACRAAAGSGRAG